MHRRRFLASGAGLAATALTGMAASLAADDDALLERLRRGSAAGRLYGLTRPNVNAGPATIVIGIEAADPIAATPALVGRTRPGRYLESTLATAMLWQSDGNG